MFTNRIRQALALVIVMAGISGMASAEKVELYFGDVTFGYLLREMTDLEALTQSPDPAYTCKQFSSYDQRSTDPAVLTDENWFANGDRGQYLREEERNGEKEYVLMDAAGPGAIVRFWSANPNDAGTVRIYLDGAAEPAIEMLLTTMLEGKHPIFPTPIAHVAAKGWNSYLPIPYHQHCKVTTSKPDFYYQINYRTYAPGTKVKSFTMREAEASLAKIQAAAQALAAPAKAFCPPAKDLNVESYEITAAAEEATAIAKFEGSAALYRMTMKVEAADIPAALRGVLLRFDVDKEQEPVVLAPIGDFFGTAPGLNPFDSLPCGVLEDGTLYSNWVMPYEYGAILRIENHSGQPVTVRGELTAGLRKWTSDSLHFHAKWRGERDIKTRPRQDWTFLDAEGKGRFVGCMLHMANPVSDWWGEGDEKIYVDKEPFPSHFGTGSEDYFGYAWCAPEVFTHAYHNQPRVDGPGNYGHTCVSRFHILDNIPFTTAFKFDMEVWHWADCKISQSAMAYWYAAPLSTDDFPRPQIGLLSVPEIPEPAGVEGALEGEKLPVLSKSGGDAKIQGNHGWGWSRDAQMWWTGAKPGDTLVLGFPVEQAGKYTILAVFTQAVDYGIAQIAVNGEPLGDPRDFYHDGVVATPEHALGVCELKAGENQFSVTITGANPKAKPAYMFGLDYLLLKPAP